MNTFFKCSGRFNFMFDIFFGVTRQEDMKQIVEQRIDVFDYVDPSYASVVIKGDEGRYSYSTDHKAALLQKAEELGFYDKLLHEDMAKTGPFRTINLSYCNSRTGSPIRPGGRLVFGTCRRRPGQGKYLLEPATACRC